MTGEDWLVTGPDEAKATLVLAHGAGAPMDSPFMEFAANALADRQIRVIRFEFPYMAERRVTGKKKPPNRAPILLECWQQVIEAAGGAESLFIGGKSMGGRMASMTACDMPVRGVICLGYPFHPPGKPDRLRTEHLSQMKAPCLICQGERDPFGKREEVIGYNLPGGVDVGWITDGDHDLKPRKSTGLSAEDNWAVVADEMARFMAE